MKRLIILPTLMLAGLLAGCPQGSSPTAGRPLEVRELPDAPKAANTSQADASRQLLISLKIVYIELPIGLAGRSEQIWSYLDEETVGPDRSAALGRNGLRVGLGKGDAWTDLAKILKKMTARQFRYSVKLMRPGRSVSVVLKKRLRRETIFISHEGRTVSGADYPAGENLLKVLCTLNEDDPSAILLTAAPQIQSAKRKTNFVPSAGRVSIISKPDVFDFPGLTFQLSMQADDFLVIGPSAQAARASSLGYQFLVKEKDSMKFETVLVMIPRVVTAPVAR